MIINKYLEDFIKSIKNKKKIVILCPRLPGKNTYLKTIKPNDCEEIKPKVSKIFVDELTSLEIARARMKK